MSKSQPNNHHHTNQVIAGKGEPVILIHGLAASLHDWDGLIPALVTEGYESFALDLLGHGDSYKPDGLKSYTSEGVFRHFKEWLDGLELKSQATIVGHSLGGYIALLAAVHHPDRIRRLILVNPFYTTEQLPALMRLFFKRPLLNTSLIEKTPYWLFRFLVDMTSLSMGSPGEGTHALPEEVRIQTALDYKRANSGIFNIPRTVRTMAEELEKIKIPVLVVWGANDQTLDPKTFPALVQALPDAEGVEMPVCGHVPHQCHVEEFNRLVTDFLGKAGR